MRDPLQLIAQGWTVIESAVRQMTLQAPNDSWPEQELVVDTHDTDAIKALQRSRLWLSVLIGASGADPAETKVKAKFTKSNGESHETEDVVLADHMARLDELLGDANPYAFMIDMDYDEVREEPDDEA